MRHINYTVDGDQVMAAYNDFRCLATDDAGFGYTVKEAFVDLIKNSKPNTNELKLVSFEMEWLEDFMSLEGN